MNVTPVRLPPGRARLATRPSRPGRCRRAKTIGIVEVAFFAARVDGIPPGSRSHRPCGRRDRRPKRAADHSGPLPSDTRSPRFVPRRSRFRQSLAERGNKRRNAPGEVLPRKPITGIAFCCARRARAAVIAPRQQAAAIRGGSSFDDLVGAGEDRWRHGEAERLGGLEIDDQLECGRLLRPADRRAWRP